MKNLPGITNCDLFSGYIFRTAVMSISTLFKRVVLDESNKPFS